MGVCIDICARAAGFSKWPNDWNQPRTQEPNNNIKRQTNLDKMSKSVATRAHHHEVAGVAEGYSEPRRSGHDDAHCERLEGHFQRSCCAEGDGDADGGGGIVGDDFS